jgi:hypothetical protein
MSEDASTPSFCLRFRLTRDDVVARAGLYPDKALRQHDGRQAVVLLAPPFFWGMFAGTLFPGLSNLGFYAGTALTMLFGLLLIVALQRRAHARFIAALADPTGTTTVTVFDDTLSWLEDGQAWSCMLEDLAPVVSTPGHDFVKVASDLVLTLPARAFADADERQAFVDHLRDARGSGAED